MAVSILYGSVLEQNNGLIIVPRSTSGSVSDSFLTGLRKMNFEYVAGKSELGTVEVFPVRDNKNLYIGFATSVMEMASSYPTITTLGYSIEAAATQLKVKNVYCPALGTGAGSLDFFLSIVYLTHAFRGRDIRFDLNIVVLDKALHTQAKSSGLWNSREFMAKAARELFESVKKDEWLYKVAASKDFFFSIAKQCYQKFLEFPIEEERLRALISYHDRFSGSFQAFMNSQTDDVRNFLQQLGELITYLDSNGYNKQIWNKYEDKRTVARSNVKQNIWTKHLLWLKLKREVGNLPPSIQNAIKFIEQPEEQLPILSEDDRADINAIFLGNVYEPLSFTRDILYFFESIGLLQGVTRINWTVFVQRILYVPLFKLLWNSDSKDKDAKVIIHGVHSNQGENSGANSTGPDPRERFSFDSKRSSVKAKIHSDLYAKDDDLNYKLYAEAISNFIRNSDVGCPATIGILAPWGVGKTTLMRFIEEKFKNKSTEHVDEAPRIKIDDIKQEVENSKLFSPTTGKLSYPTVWFNAWKFENGEQVFSALAHNIITQLTEQIPSTLEREKFFFSLNKQRFNYEKLKEDIRIKLFKSVVNPLSLLFLVGSAVTGALVYTLATIPGVLLGSSGMVFLVFKFLIQWIAKGQQTVRGSFTKYVNRPVYEDKLGYFYEVESDLKKVFTLLVDKDKPCIIFIDDLDRCAPKKVVDVIEAINQFVNGELPNCYFVIGMDAHMVATSIQTVYESLDKKLGHLQKSHGSIGWYFLEKFVQLHFVIPNMNQETTKKFLKKLFAIKNDDREDTEAEVKDLNNRVQGIVVSDLDSIKKINQEINKLEAKNPVAAATVKEAFIAHVAKDVEDSDGDLDIIIENYWDHLGSSPRVHKRFANLFRFYRFVQYTNISGDTHTLDSEQLVQMIIVNLRWPQLSRIIQWNVDGEVLDAKTSIGRAGLFDAAIHDPDNWSNLCAKIKDKENYEWMLTDGFKEFISTHKINTSDFVNSGHW